MQGLHNGNQLGNRVYEILGLAAIAKKLGRKPTFLLASDPFNEPVIKQLWLTLLYFPRILDGFYLEREKIDASIAFLPLVKLKGDVSTYFNLSLLEDLKSERIIVMETGLLQNFDYLNDLGWSDVVHRLSFSKATIEAANFLVPDNFTKKDKRFCIHLRRNDFGELATNFSFVIDALNLIIKNVTNLGITIFSDDPIYVEKMIKTERYAKFSLITWLPRSDHPIHLVWAFFSNYCTHILITNIQSTFGFFGAYLAPKNVTVYFNTRLGWKHSVPTPDSWIAINL